MSHEAILKTSARQKLVFVEPSPHMRGLQTVPNKQTLRYK